MKCESCGLSVAEGANFCSHCGAATSLQGRVSAESTGAPAGTGTPGASVSSDDAASYYMSPKPDVGAEQVLWDESPSMRTAIPGIVAWVLGGLTIIILLGVLDAASGLRGQGFSLYLQIAVLLIVAGTLVRFFIRKKSLRYRLSTQRIFVTHGLLNKRTDEIELEKYKDVFVNQDFWDKIVGCGDIEVITGDVTNPTIRIIDVTDPVSKKESIRAAARERKSALGINRREEL